MFSDRLVAVGVLVFCWFCVGCTTATPLWSNTVFVQFTAMTRAANKTAVVLAVDRASTLSALLPSDCACPFWVAR